MNQLIRELIINQINKAKSDSITAKHLGHPYLIGKLREIILNTLITPLLNSNFGIGTGKVVDSNGNLSKEIDLCVYSKDLLPAFFFLEKEGFGTFPIESVLKCIEVKSTLDFATLKGAYDNFKYIEDNLLLTSGYRDENGWPYEHYAVKHKYEVFAFDFSGAEYSKETLLGLYKKIDPLWETEPLICSICVVGKGWLVSSNNGYWHLPYDEATGIHEEIIGYLCTSIGDLPNIEASRGVPHLGNYLVNVTNMKRP